MKVFATYTSLFCLMSMVFHARGAANGVHHASERRLRHSYDPVQDDVTSPPVSKYTGNPSYSPTGEPTRSPSRTPTPMPSISPSSTPTAPPSWLPSLDPSPSPSTLPSHEPSSLPSLNPSLSSSTRPSNEPTVVPTVSPSSLPSVLPTVVPSAAPTTIPSANPTGVPTVVYSTVPTVSEIPSVVSSGIPSSSMSPTEIHECLPGEDGLFGSEGDTQVVVKFAYELETNPSIASNVIPPLENAFSAAILPGLFSEKCSQRNKIGVRRRRLVATGVSTRPEDIVLDSVSCGQTDAQSNNCAVVQGELTIFLLEGTSDPAVKDNIIQILRNGMTNGEFLYAHPDIERVTFVDLSAVPKSVAASEDSPTPAPSNGAGLNVLWVVIATVSGLVLVLATFLWRRKQEEEESEEDSEAHEGSLDPGAEQSIEQTESPVGEA
eukprot:CAMPEP_0119003752 /NCGR_PEP_ID=MMETSP1176-20130426/745_1 /TAXON_ID=265551 /ORGANISM="Synedropsis recta cf, Strain CCMP1620" /LENGTH=433 /DNA_ID=CAMNT_0006955377 /DNA_START=74 /DNA_END=1375 /DNA_ORIENTATION=+